MGAAFASPAMAAPAGFAEPYNYVVLDQDVRVALTEFGRNVGLPVVLSDAVNGRVRGRIEARTAGEFIERLAGANGLTWYFDGSVLHISADKEFMTRVLDAGRLSGEAVASEMRELGLADERFSLRAARNGNVITVSGPPAYINVVGQLVERMQPEQVVAGDDPRVRVFRGGVMTEVVATHGAGTGSDDENASRANRVARP
ncbi:type III secretion protein [Phyllobacterium phragmitis]|uniref:Type III secretion protein n=1 Tax=Phyllobacterium phragmitis TaxID=2670329 RepID=A0A2S9IMI9_9HYPH|nr:secretin N-terminal domain-containing protein [Phyllobacterium phragmitis]PRD41749.1 type III secretion protein [Phyllobacterium phragmitis]